MSTHEKWQLFHPSTASFFDIRVSFSFFSLAAARTICLLKEINFVSTWCAISLFLKNVSHYPLIKYVFNDKFNAKQFKILPSKTEQICHLDKLTWIDFKIHRLILDCSFQVGFFFYFIGKLHQKFHLRVDLYL